jgi:hypothetical protein
MVFDSSIRRHLCLGGQGCPDRRGQTGGGILQILWVPDDSEMVVGIKMHL